MRLYRGESARVSISKSSSTWILHGEHTTQVFHILKPKKQDTLRFRFRLDTVRNSCIHGQGRRNIIAGALIGPGCNREQFEDREPIHAVFKEEILATRTVRRRDRGDDGLKNSPMRVPYILKVGKWRKQENFKRLKLFKSSFEGTSYPAVCGRMLTKF